MVDFAAVGAVVVGGVIVLLLKLGRFFLVWRMVSFAPQVRQVVGSLIVKILYHYFLVFDFGGDGISGFDGSFDDSCCDLVD